MNGDEIETLLQQIDVLCEDIQCQNKKRDTRAFMRTYTGCVVVVCTFVLATRAREDAFFMLLVAYGVNLLPALVLLLS
jgi:hypothetical protein